MDEQDLYRQESLNVIVRLEEFLESQRGPEEREEQRKQIDDSMTSASKSWKKRRVER